MLKIHYDIGLDCAVRRLKLILLGCMPACILLFSQLTLATPLALTAVASVSAPLPDGISPVASVLATPGNTGSALKLPAPEEKKTSEKPMAALPDIPQVSTFSAEPSETLSPDQAVATVTVVSPETPAVVLPKDEAQQPSGARSKRETESAEQAVGPEKRLLSGPASPPNTETSEDSSLRQELQNLARQVAQLQASNENAHTTPSLLLLDPLSKQAYASGVALATIIDRAMDEQHRLGIILPRAAVLAGLSDTLMEQPLRLRATEIRTLLNDLDASMVGERVKIRDANRQGGDAWRSFFEKRTDVKVIGGAGYQIQSPGTGERLLDTDMIDVNINESHVNAEGKVISNASETSDEKRVRVDALLPAITRGLKMLRAGGQIRIVLPPEQAYGDTGLAPNIPGGATIIYDITVIAVNPVMTH